MRATLPKRVSVLGWGNVFLGMIYPISSAFNLLDASQIFTVTYAGESMLFVACVGLVLGAYHWISGRAILEGRLEAFDRNAVTGGMTLGYTVIGILTMATSGRDGMLVVLIRHGSADWWNWSYSHFQHSALREIPLLVWWVYGLGTIVRFRLPGAPERARTRLAYVLGYSIVLVVFGAVVRMLQSMTDSSLYSQR